MVNVLIKENILKGDDTIHLWTARCLRDNVDLRPVQRRADLVKAVWKVSGSPHSPDVICRAARKIQNKMGLYRPENDDQREILEGIRREEYGKDI